MKTYIFDGTLEGLLTAVFDFFNLKPGFIELVAKFEYQPALIDDSHEVITDREKANRVWKGLEKKLEKSWLKKIYVVSLSEKREAFNHLLGFIVYLFNQPKGAENNYGNPDVLAMAQIDRKVHREKHRMEAFVRFQETKDGIFYAPVEPDYNVLPLISNHFRRRYADQKWIIYDLKRQYGLYYDKQNVEQITIDFLEEKEGNSALLPEKILDPKEELYSILWQDYFKSTNIEARKNTKLHIQHVPKRYWKYLTEKWER